MIDHQILCGKQLQQVMYYGSIALESLFNFYYAVQCSLPVEFRVKLLDFFGK